MRKIMFLVSLFALCITRPAWAVHYINVRPMSEMNLLVQDCTNNWPKDLYVITWGGDEKTVLANGDSKITTKDSLFGQNGFQFKLVREDVFRKQLEGYMSCRSPFLRGTMGMIKEAQELTDRDQRTKMEVLYQLTWSNGGDTAVGKKEIRNACDFKGKNIAINADGPHTDFLNQILSGCNLTMRDVNLFWTKDLTGTDETPRAALETDSKIDIAMVISPDAMEMTSGGTVCDGKECLVRGAHIVLTSKTMNRQISDVYVVRHDYAVAHPEVVETFKHALMLADEKLYVLMHEKEAHDAEYKKLLTAAADILLDNPQKTEDVIGMYGDAEFVGFAGNVEFFTNPNNLRNLAHIDKEINDAYIAIGLLSKNFTLGIFQSDYNKLKVGLTKTENVIIPRFDTAAATAVVEQRRQQGTLDASAPFPSFSIPFQPQSDSFPANLYDNKFDEALAHIASSRGALVVVEGNVDPTEYIRAKRDGHAEFVVSAVAQKGKSDSMKRAFSVRNALVVYARSKHVEIDETQFVVVPNGIWKPLTGMCGADPCPSKTEEQWKANMRAEFKIINVESESSVFRPL